MADARMESELGRAATLVGEVIDLREEGIVDEMKGSADDDLLGAIEALEDAIKGWRATRASGREGSHG